MYAFYVVCLFSCSSNGVLAFYAIQQVAQAGWSPVLFRVMQGITAPCVRYIYIFLIPCGLHNHLFIWLDPVVDHDALIATKVGYLNFPLDC
jgi:hypothetical protein